MRFWRTTFIVAALGLGSSAFVAVQPVDAAPTSNWMISASAIGLIDGYVGNSTLTTNAFDVAQTIEIGKPAGGWVSQPAMTFTFYGPVSKSSSFLYALKHNKIPAGTQYVMLDMESWSLTPHPEQVTPKVYMSEFVTAAHKHGYKALLAPSLDLTKGMTCSKSTDPSWRNYLVDCAVPGIVAAAAPDVFEVQSQTLEANTSANANCACFQWFVDQAVAQARSVRATLDVRAGLSTNPSGHVSTGQTLYTDTLNTDSAADGYWLNVPQQGTACPSCVPGGAPQVAVDYLKLLGYTD